MKKLVLTSCVLAGVIAVAALTVGRTNSAKSAGQVPGQATHAVVNATLPQVAHTNGQTAEYNEQIIDANSYPDTGRGLPSIAGLDQGHSRQVAIDTNQYPDTGRGRPQTGHGPPKITYPERLPAVPAVVAAYDNTIAPDEDLLAPHGQSASPETPIQPNTNASIPTRDAAPPATAAPVLAPPEAAHGFAWPEPAETKPAITAQPAAPAGVQPSPEENLLLGSPAPTPKPSVVENVAPPAVSPEPTGGVTPSPAASRPKTDVTATQPTAAPAPPTTGQANSLKNWSKDTLPASDEDHLTGLSTEPATAPTTTPVQSDPVTPAPVKSLLNPNPAPPASQNSSPSAASPNSQSSIEPPANAEPPQWTAPPPSLTSPSAVPSPHQSGSAQSAPSSSNTPGVDPHAEVFAETLYPSAKKCSTCHEQIYNEWAGSSHAYASISPMFQKFEQTLHGLTQGTISHFCMRCHAPVATSLTYPREASILDSIPSAHEGVTCIACHRVNEEYGKVNGERKILTGDIYEPVYGSGYGEGLAEVLANKSLYKVKSDPSEKGPGQDIHRQVIHFEQISSSHFCVSCHQVVVYPGIALEVVWAQYRASPACKMGITCQECHMGREPGVADGYEIGPVAVINNIEVSPHRKHSNHMFYGPGYSIAHPGIFPFNAKADDWTSREWLQFDYRAGWGTEGFEELVEGGKIKVNFPEIWDDSDDRMDAREVVDINLGKLEAKRQMRHRLMENGSSLHGPVFAKPPQVGKTLRFHYDVTNTNLGHNMPSGSLGAQPQVWLNVVLTGPAGQRLWESGYLDAIGDLADVHSLEVAAGRIRRDQQLFNLQTKFLITHVKGTDREMYLPVNTDFDQLPFIRPSAFPITVMNHPPFIRMEGHSLPPLGTRAAKYHVPGKLIRQPGVYRLSVRMRSRAEPIYLMRFCNATPEMERNMNEWMLDYHEETFEFLVQ